MAHLMFLENFDGTANFDQKSPRPEDLPGFMDGFAAGQAAASKQSKQLTTQVVAELSELKFGFAEAQMKLLQDLAPFIDAICNQLLPAILDDVSRSRLFETLFLAAQSDISRPLTLTLHSGQTHAIQQTIEEFAITDFEIIGDDSLNENEIVVSRGNYETHLDTPAMVAELCAALRMLPSNERKAS